MINALPVKNSDEKCILRKSNFHRILPTYSKYNEPKETHSNHRELKVTFYSYSNK